MRKQGKGFTLVELMIVIALIVVIASIVIPFSLRARMQSNEAATISNLRTVSSSAEAFRSAQTPSAYATDLTEMVNTIPPYLDSSWLDMERQGYNYAYTRSEDGERYSLAATPRIANVSGINSYCVDHTGVIRRYPEGGTLAGGTGCDSSGTPI